MNDILYDIEKRERWIESLPDGVPCDHVGCLSHISHPCEGCGRVGGIRKPNFYYCTSEWEHAVVLAKTSDDAKTKFIEIINGNLIPSKFLVMKDVKASIINVYM